jgi:hypothetical protein
MFMKVLSQSKIVLSKIMEQLVAMAMATPAQLQVAEEDCLEMVVRDARAAVVVAAVRAVTVVEADRSSLIAQSAAVVVVAAELFSRAGTVF